MDVRQRNLLWIGNASARMRDVRFLVGVGGPAKRAQVRGSFSPQGAALPSRDQDPMGGLERSIRNKIADEQPKLPAYYVKCSTGTWNLRDTFVQPCDSGNRFDLPRI